MIKYLIKVKDGWVSDPLMWEDGVPGVTKDVFKAWMFDKKEKSQEELMVDFGRAVDMKLWYDKTYEPVELTGADPIIEWLDEEEVLTGKKLGPEQFEDLNGEIKTHVSISEGSELRIETFKDGGYFVSDNKPAVGGIRTGTYKAAGTKPRATIL